MLTNKPYIVMEQKNVNVEDLYVINVMSWCWHADNYFTHTSYGRLC